MFCCPKIEPNFQISMLGRFGPLNIIKLPEGCFDVLNVTKLPPLSERFTVQNVTNTPPYQKERKMTDLMVKNLMSVQSSHPWAKALLFNMWQISHLARRRERWQTWWWRALWMFKAPTPGRKLCCPNGKMWQITHLARRRERWQTWWWRTWWPDQRVAAGPSWQSRRGTGHTGPQKC